MESKRILVAGIGNIFLGDDGFGCEVLRVCAQRPWRPEVTAIDFGIRSHDLAYALTENYQAVILVDATARGAPPGTAFLLELDLDTLGPSAEAPIDAHSLQPLHVLHMARSMGARPEQLFLVGCEPADLGGEEGRLGLSEAVQSAVPTAVEMVESLVVQLLNPSSDPALGILSHEPFGVSPR